MKIEVTEQDINNGVRSSSCECPIALAIKRCIGIQPYHLSVRLTDVWYETKENVVVSELPVEAVKFIEAYDKKQSVKPFSFTLKVTGMYPVKT